MGRERAPLFPEWKAQSTYALWQNRTGLHCETGKKRAGKMRARHSGAVARSRLVPSGPRACACILPAVFSRAEIGDYSWPNLAKCDFVTSEEGIPNPVGKVNCTEILAFVNFISWAARRKSPDTWVGLW